MKNFNISKFKDLFFLLLLVVIVFYFSNKFKLEGTVDNLDSLNSNNTLASQFLFYLNRLDEITFDTSSIEGYSNSNSENRFNSYEPVTRPPSRYGRTNPFVKNSSSIIQSRPTQTIDSILENGTDETNEE